MVVEGEGPCIVYQIKPAGIPESLKGYKVGGRVVKKDAVQNVINYLNNPSGELTEQEKELLKRPFTNELVSKELDIILFKKYYQNVRIGRFQRSSLKGRIACLPQKRIRCRARAVGLW